MKSGFDMRETQWQWKSGLASPGLLGGTSDRSKWNRGWRKCRQVQEVFSMDEGNAVGYEAMLWGSLAALEGRQAALEAELADVKAAREATLRALPRHGDGALGGRRPVTVEELNRCSSQREGLKMIAERSEGRIKLGEAVRLIHESELTSAKLPSLRTALHRYVNGSPEWTAEGRGFYRLSGFSGSDQNALEGAFTVHEPGGVYTEKRFRVDPGKGPVVDDIEDGEDLS